MIKKCPKIECVSDYQDKQYGEKRRIHNETNEHRLRCTVCGNVVDGKRR